MAHGEHPRRSRNGDGPGRARRRQGGCPDVLIEVRAIRKDDVGQRPSRVPRPRQGCRSMVRMGDVQSVGGLGEGKLESLILCVGRRHLVGCPAGGDLGPVLVNPDVEVTEFEDVGLSRRELEGHQAALAVGIPGRGNVVRPRSPLGGPVRHGDKVLHGAKGVVVLFEVHTPLKPRTPFPRVKGCDGNVLARHRSPFYWLAPRRRWTRGQPRQRWRRMGSIFPRSWSPRST